MFELTVESVSSHVEEMLQRGETWSVGFNNPPKRVMHIIKEEAQRTGFTVAEICGRSKSQPLVRIRQFAMWRAKRETGRSLPEIARVFGGRDHTTVLHAIRVINNLSDTERAQIGVSDSVPSSEATMKIFLTLPRQVRGETYEGHACPKGHTTRYMTTNKCVDCCRAAHHWKKRRCDDVG